MEAGYHTGMVCHGRVNTGTVTIGGKNGDRSQLRPPILNQVLLFLNNKVIRLDSPISVNVALTASSSLLVE